MSTEITVGADNIQKYIEQAERKREYNRKYYQNHTKLKRVQEKQSIQSLEKRCQELETLLSKKSQTSDEIVMKRQLTSLAHENTYLKQQMVRMTNEINELRECLQANRLTNYELMLQKSDIFLPDIQNITLKQ